MQNAVSVCLHDKALPAHSRRSLCIQHRVFTNSTRAQSNDPHLPPPRSLPSLNEFVRIDDMLLYAEQYRAAHRPAGQPSSSEFLLRSDSASSIGSGASFRTRSHPTSPRPNASASSRPWRPGRAPRRSRLCREPRKPASWRSPATSFRDPRRHRASPPASATASEPMHRFNLGRAWLPASHRHDPA